MEAEGGFAESRPRYIPSLNRIVLEVLLGCAPLHQYWYFLKHVCEREHVAECFTMRDTAFSGYWWPPGSAVWVSQVKAIFLISFQ